MTQSPTPQGIINFLKYTWVYALISAIVIIPGIYALATWGLLPSIDFTGGSLLELKFLTENKVSSADIATLLPEGISLSSSQETSDNGILLRLSPMSKDQNLDLQTAIASRAANMDATASALLDPGQYVQELRFESVGPTLGKELLQKTFAAILLAAVSIMLYVAYRFKNLKYGVCAILAMFHDSLVLLGIFALLGHYANVDVDTLFVTAVLTTLSFSVHDTIVVYDRIRERTRKYPGYDYGTTINISLTETMTRSLNNSLTIIFMLLALLLFGGETIRWFVLALLVGTISGTYSSPFVAAPLLVVWDSILSKLTHRQ